MKEVTCPVGKPIDKYTVDTDAKFSEFMDAIRNAEDGETVRFPVPSYAWLKLLRVDLLEAQDALDAEYCLLAEFDTFTTEAKALVVTRYQLGTYGDRIKFWLYSQLMELADGESLGVQAANEDVRWRVFCLAEQFGKDKRVPIAVTCHPEGRANYVLIERMHAGQRGASVLSKARAEIAEIARKSGPSTSSAPAYHSLEVGDQCELDHQGGIRAGNIRSIIYAYGKRTNKKFQVKQTDTAMVVTRIS